MVTLEGGMKGGTGEEVEGEEEGKEVVVIRSYNSSKSLPMLDFPLSSSNKAKMNKIQIKWLLSFTYQVH